MSVYQKGLSVNPFSAEGHFNLGRLYFSQGKVEEGKREFSEAAMLNPELIKQITASKKAKDNGGNSINFTLRDISSVEIRLDVINGIHRINQEIGNKPYAPFAKESRFIVDVAKRSYQRTILLVSDDTIIGCLIYGPRKPNSQYIYFMAVDAGLQRFKLGTRMLDHLVEKMYISADVKMIAVETSRDNPCGAFYYNYTNPLVGGTNVALSGLAPDQSHVLMITYSLNNKDNGGEQNKNEDPFGEDIFCFKLIKNSALAFLTAICGICAILIIIDPERLILYSGIIFIYVSLG